MSAIYILMGALLLALLFVEISFSIRDKRKEQVKELLKLDEAHLLEELGRATLLLKLCLISGLLLSGLYAVSAFAGSELQHISQWGFTHWLGAFIGLVVVVTITLSQSFAHSSQMHNVGRFVVVILLITFAIFSEISNPSEREEMKMEQKSQDSEVFKAVLGEIKGGSNHQPDYSQSLAAAQATLAKHQFELGRCDRHADKGEQRVKRCEDHENRAIAQAQAQIASYQQADINAANQSSADKQALIQQAKGLEQNADHHSAIIKFLKVSLNTDYQHAMILAALILVVAFEAGFGFAGYNVAIYREALVQKGNKDILYAIEAKRIKAAHAFREKTNRYQREMMTTQDKGSPSAEIKGGDTGLKSASNNIHMRAHEAMKANRDKQKEIETTETEENKTAAQSTENKPKSSDSESMNTVNKGVETIKQYADDYRKKKEQPSTAFTRNEHTGTQEKNYDLFGGEKHKTPEQLAAEKAEINAEMQTLNANLADRTATVADDRSGTVQVSNKNGQEKAVYSTLLDTKSFDRMYAVIRANILNKTITPSARSLANVVVDSIKNDDDIALITVSLPECRQLANKVRERLVAESIIKENPHYKNGCAKYVLV